MNHAPSGTDTSIAGYKNKFVTINATDFGFTDPDGNRLLQVAVVALPTVGTLMFDSDGPGGSPAVAVTAGQIVTRADIDAGKLTYAPPTDASGSAVASFSFRVQD